MEVGVEFLVAGNADFPEHARKKKLGRQEFHFSCHLSREKEELPKFLWKLGVFMKIAVTAQHSLT